jgi:hypothetical protein
LIFFLKLLPGIDGFKQSNESCLSRGQFDQQNSQKIDFKSEFERQVRNDSRKTDFRLSKFSCAFHRSDCRRKYFPSPVQRRICMVKIKILSGVTG